MRPILVPNVNCLPDPATIPNAQMAGVTDVATGRVFLTMMLPTADTNKDPYTAVVSGNPVVQVNKIKYNDIDDEFYRVSETTVPRIPPQFAIDLSTNQTYILIGNGETANWMEFGRFDQKQLEDFLVDVGVIFDHSTPHPIFK